ncbi:hypothetical protein SC1_02974 [Sphingopyxis sp. C-1]|nr:hypothetical protein SC1_02974 [Sphingopyxis sp. C-1]
MQRNQAVTARFARQPFPKRATIAIFENEIVGQGAVVRKEMVDG